MSLNCSCAFAANGKHIYLLHTERRIEKLAAPGWNHDPQAADQGSFLPGPGALYQRIRFLKP